MTQTDEGRAGVGRGADAMSEKKTLADDIRAEDRELTRRFKMAAIAKRGPMTLEEAMQASASVRVDEQELTSRVELESFRTWLQRQIAACDEQMRAAVKSATKRSRFADHSLLLAGILAEFDRREPAHAQAVQRLTEERDAALRSQACWDWDAEAMRALQDRAEQAEAALAALRAQVAALPDPVTTDPMSWHGDSLCCGWCGATWGVEKEPHFMPWDYLRIGARLHPDNGCPALLRPRPEGST